VINYKEQGVADRDGRAVEVMRWAAANGVGKLQHHMSRSTTLVYYINGTVNGTVPD
jgi:hypothetical protein